MMPYDLQEEAAIQYRLADGVHLEALCHQPLRLQKIQDRHGNTIIVAIGEDHTVVTLAYEVRPRERRAKMPTIATTTAWDGHVGGGSAGQEG